MPPIESTDVPAYLDCRQVTEYIFHVTERGAWQRDRYPLERSERSWGHRMGPMESYADAKPNALIFGRGSGRKSSPRATPVAP